MSKKLEFKNYFDGDCLNRYDGVLDGDTLTVEFIISAKDSKEIFVCGASATKLDNGDFSAKVTLHSGKNEIFATDGKGNSTCLTLYHFPNHNKKHYRISSDDNIVFLEELTHGDYASVFDHPYLAVYKKAHDLYGAMVQLNLFYEYCEVGMGYFSKPKEYFNLSMMTDKYKAEFKANSSWLKFAFHSKNELSHPYANATPDEILADEEAVRREVIRFAGADSYSFKTTTTHYGSGTKECVKALRNIGYRSLTGYFTVKNEKPRVSYYLDLETVQRVEKRDMWYDRETDMFLVRIDKVLNESPNEINLEYLDALTDDAYRGGFISIMIHEQYFYSDYRKYKPDFEALVLDASKLLYERGYRSIHLPELLQF